MAKIQLKDIQKLKTKTGVGLAMCKDALQESEGNIEKAIEILRKKGILKAAKRSLKEATQGTIGYYIHNGSIGSIVELKSETDFVARNEKFQSLANDLAVQIVATNPPYLKIEDIPQELIEKESEIYKEELKKLKGNEEILKKALDGKLRYFYEELCLMEQKFVKDNSKTIKDMLDEALAAFGEKIEIGRFARLEIGEHKI